ncbi:chemotaxis protein [Desulfocurvibacter africanus PCS]|uniref:Probable chemoreceptor glutamine deamidase CheD n=2 Tax=Desulfocurvibacter africanus TaxID=873 RepID=M5PSA9_DESAF|nr:chemotaxis protein [Desulfocurvibacter africanus PCS]
MRQMPAGTPEMNIVYLMIAAGGVFVEPTTVQTVLGSCVSVTFHCPVRHIGGIFHALLPRAADYPRDNPASTPYKYVDTAILAVLDGLEKQGVRRQGLEAKVFGGSCGNQDQSSGVGLRNVEVAFETLERCRVRVKAADVGGRRGRKLLFMSHAGDVYVKRLGAEMAGGDESRRP